MMLGVFAYRIGKLSKVKVSFYVDGYNLFHGLDKAFPDFKKYLKWLDIHKMFQNEFMNKADSELVDVFYFSATPSHLSQNTLDTHNAYKLALENSGVKYIGGKFKLKTKTHKCPNCKNVATYQEHEEKESDVNLALYILRDAYEKISDKLFVVTNDSDISPAIRMALQINPKLKIRVLTPPLGIGTNGKTYMPNWDLLEACNQTRISSHGQKIRKPLIIKEIHCSNNLFPEKIIATDGKEIVCPEKYMRKI